MEKGKRRLLPITAKSALKVVRRRNSAGESMSGSRNLKKIVIDISAIELIVSDGVHYVE